MSNKNIEKYNRSKAAGGPFPLAHEQMQKLRYWYQSKLSNNQLMILLLVWLKQDFTEVAVQKKFPMFYRFKSSQLAEKKSIRIIRDAGVSWVEYSTEVRDGEFIWMPIPSALKGFFWRVLQEHHSYENSILSTQESNDLYNIWMSKMMRPRADRGIKMSQKTAWANYISNYCHADTTLSSNSKSVFLSKLHHRSVTAYQNESIESVRYQLYRSINNSVNRLFLEAEKWGILPDFSRSINQHEVIPNRHERQAQYLIESIGIITEIQIDYKAHHREINKVASSRVGTNTSVDKVVVSNLFKTLENILVVSKGKAKNRLAFINYYNQCTYVFALQLILLTSIRPTHQISPLLAALSVDRFSIKDKGQSRSVLLSSFMQEQVIRYQRIQSCLRDTIPCISPSPYLLFLVDEDFQVIQLTAKKLRLFVGEHWSGHVPYQLRKMHAQILMELKLPNHLLDRTMGHSRLGEHDGAMTVFPYEEQVILAVLNKLPDIFKMELFDA